MLRDQLSLFNGDTVDDDVIVCSVQEDRARQEFKAETDTESIIRRLGAGIPFQNGFVDYDVDLTRAFAMLEEARTAWERLPGTVREKFKNWSEVEAAASSGQLGDMLKPPAAAEVSSAAGGGSASVSAAVGGT